MKERTRHRRLNAAAISGLAESDRRSFARFFAFRIARSKISSWLRGGDAAREALSNGREISFVPRPGALKAAECVANHFTHRRVAIAVDLLAHECLEWSSRMMLVVLAMEAFY